MEESMMKPESAAGEATEEAALQRCGLRNDAIRAAFSLPETDPGSCSSLALAFLGDAVYELIIRTLVVDSLRTNPNRLNRESSALAKAGAQAELLYAVWEDLTPEEAAVYRRGRNAHSATKAKNATVHDYRVATGFEALMGYLYLSGQEERALSLVRLGLSRRAEKEKDAPDADGAE